jgi:hypothetical protein
MIIQTGFDNVTLIVTNTDPHLDNRMLPLKKLAEYIWPNKPPDVLSSMSLGWPHLHVPKLVNPMLRRWDVPLKCSISQGGKKELLHTPAFPPVRPGARQARLNEVLKQDHEAIRFHSAEQLEFRQTNLCTVRDFHSLDSVKEDVPFGSRNGAR